MDQCLGKRVVKEEKFPHTQKLPHRWGHRSTWEFQRGTQQQVFGWKQNGQNSPQKLLPTRTSQLRQCLHAGKYKPWLRTATPEIDMLLATTKACGTDLEISLQTKGGQIKAEHQRLCGQRRGREFVPAVIGALVKSPQFA
ncbi:unnamed protein product [Rangifer tarandus platyrhynchus]|uniref:Uncharacterized protein n=1 Tax=Rangifer tarandus platyrhynchus TaxID=3082113 RepID=A0ABN8XYQ5_RANTA|nr:unnamed protein product [Rangifer tarandus platyrhynchus]